MSRPVLMSLACQDIASSLTRLMPTKVLPQARHTPTACNEPSQVQSQLSATGVHTRCNDKRRNWFARQHRRKNVKKQTFPWVLVLATPRHAVCDDLQHDGSSQEYIWQCQISGTDCNWPHTCCNWLRHNIALQSVATCMPGISERHES